MKKSAGFAALFFAAATVAMTWPLAADLRHFISDPGDPYLNTWILHWDWRALTHDPLHLFNANIFYPSRLTLAFSENLVGVSIIGFPLYAAGAPPIVVYNVLMLLGFALSGFGAWALARHLCGSSSLALIAGILYAFAPFRFDHLAHIQMEWGGFLPLFLLFLLRYFEERRRRDLALFALCFAWNGLCCIHFAVFGGLALLLTCLLEFSRRDLWRDKVVRRALFAAVAAASAVLFPFYVPYAVASRLYHFRRHLGEMTYYSALPSTFLNAGVRNRMYGELTGRFAKAEAGLFPGVLILILAAVGILASRTRRAPAPSPRPRPQMIPILDGLLITLGIVRLAVALTGGFQVGRWLSIHQPFRLSALIAVLAILRLSIAFPKRARHSNLADYLRRHPLSAPALWGAGITVLGVLTCLGGNFFFYRELYEVFPFLFGSIRCPARAIVLADLGLGVLGAIGAARLLEGRRPLPRALLTTLFLAVLFLEYRAAPISYFHAPAEPGPATRWLSKLEFEGAVFELPMKLEDNFEYVYRVTQHGHPLVNGFSGFFPRDFLALQKAIAEEAGDESLLRRVRATGARILLYHPSNATQREATRIPQFLLKGLESGELMPAALFEEESGNTLGFALPPSPAAAGPALPRADPKTSDAMISILRNPVLHRDPPAGYLDLPEERHVFSSSDVTGIGWASCEAGIDRIEVHLDGRLALLAPYGGPRPDVAKVFPNLPCGANCGFSFQLKNLSAGPHSLEVVLKARNGKETKIPPKSVTVGR